MEYTDDEARTLPHLSDTVAPPTLHHHDEVLALRLRAAHVTVLREEAEMNHEPTKICPRHKCQGVMRPGWAINTRDPNVRVCFVAPKDDGTDVIEVLKCRVCGHTVTSDHPLEER